MKVVFLLLFFLLLLVSCKQELPENHYKSKDEFTGGLNNFSLDLNSNGKLKLSIESYKSNVVSDSGTAVESSIKSLTGTWAINNNTIEYRLNESKLTIDSFFRDLELNNYSKDKSILSFSDELDTAYIYGIPCITVIKNK